MLPVRQKQVSDVFEKHNHKKSEFEFIPINNDRFKVVFRPLPRFQFSINENNTCNHMSSDDLTDI